MVPMRAHPSGPNGPTRAQGGAATQQRAPPARRQQARPGGWRPTSSTLSEVLGNLGKYRYLGKIDKDFFRKRNLEFVQKRESLS